MSAPVTLLVGTRKGLFRFRGRPGGTAWERAEPALAGWEVYHAALDPRDPSVGWAAARHAVWGAHLFRSGDGGASWRQAEGRPAFPDGAGRSVEALWHVAPAGGDRPRRLWVGAEPAALFLSEDGGRSWRWIQSLEEHPTRRSWQPAKGGMALHSLRPDPRDPERGLWAAVSAGGVYRTRDGGESWTALNRGVRADHLPERYPEAGQCVHAVRVHPDRPERLYRQCHCGTYRSDDGGGSWTEITEGLPSDFGYALALDPGDPDRAWVVPEESGHLRTVCGRRLRLFETADAGATWIPRDEGLPRDRAWVSVLREALAADGASPPGLYLGTSSGHLFSGRDGGAWRQIAALLPKILSVSGTRAG